MPREEDRRRETRAFYDKIARFYDVLADHSEARVRRAGIGYLEPAPGERILEVGCGTGHCLADLAEAVGSGGRVFGLDLAGGMLAVAGVTVHERGVAEHVDLVCGDALYLPFRSSSLDAVFLSFTLELFDTPEIPLVLAECRRVLRPGGRIGVVGMSNEGEQGLTSEVYEWTHRHFPNFVDCRPIFVRGAVEAAGFQVRTAVRQSMWVPVEIVVGVKG